jgi:hypothetical protein
MLQLTCAKGLIAGDNGARLGLSCLSRFVMGFSSTRARGACVPE